MFRRTLEERYGRDLFVTSVTGDSAIVYPLPVWELFEERSSGERAAVLRPDLPSLAVEAGSTLGWHRWVDDVVGIDRFGASAPGGTVLHELGIEPANVAARARALLDASEDS